MSGSATAELPATVVTAAPVEDAADLPKPGQAIEITAPALLQPRGGVLINGERLDDLLLEFEVINNRYYAADSFRCTLRLNENDPKYGLPFWSDQDGIEIEIFAGFGVDRRPTQSLVAGRVDQIDVDLETREVHLAGRDYTADLLEARIAEKWPNKTASEIVRLLAERYGLSPVVADTKTLAGVYYKREHAQLADETNAWNLITYLAEREGFDAFVQGKELHFEPPPDPATASKWELRYTPASSERAAPEGNAGGLRLTRSLTASRDITVKVVSWNKTKKSSLTGTARSTRPARRSNGQFSSGVTHVFRIPGLTQEGADREAERLLREMTKHLRSCDVSVPGDPTVDIRTIVTLRGTRGSFDTDYHLDEIVRRLAQNRAFTMHVRGRNVIPDSTAAL